MTEKDSKGQCKYCEGKDMRETLAEALESGRYEEQPAEPRHSHAQLRDSQDRYTITGVAVDAMFPFLWIRNQGNWYAFDHEQIPEEWQRRDLPREMPEITQEEFEEIESGGSGDSTICPERTACFLGLHINHEHPQILEINCSILTPKQKEEAGIPRGQTKNYPLNMLGFQAAAKLLREEPNLLVGDCTCDQEDNEES